MQFVSIIFTLMLLCSFATAQEPVVTQNNDNMNAYNDPNNITGTIQNSDDTQRFDQQNTNIVIPESLNKPNIIMQNNNDSSRFGPGGKIQIGNPEPQVNIPMQVQPETQSIDPMKGDVSQFTILETDVYQKIQTELERRIKKAKATKATKEQIDAIGIPLPQIKYALNTKTQVRPPNIAQKYYDTHNRHLTPVMFADEYAAGAIKIIMNGSDDMATLKAIINYLNEPNMMDVYGNTILMYAIFQKNYKLLMHLINRGTIPSIINDFGFNALHLACYMGDKIAAFALLDSGMNPNSLDIDGNSPMMYAAYAGNISIVMKIVALGGNIRHINNMNINVMDFAYASGSLDIVDYLLQMGESLLISKRIMQDNALGLKYDFPEKNKIIDQYGKNMMQKMTYFYYAT